MSGKKNISILLNIYFKTKTTYLCDVNKSNWSHIYKDKNSVICWPSSRHSSHTRQRKHGLYLQLY